MKHLGDITKLRGGEILPVHVITGGSPCQDLSIAGKRKGLAGARSGLFMDQIRIIKEMREKHGAAYPRYMAWENVPGAFSSNKGRDFAAVLEETIRIAEPEAPDIEVPAKGWPTWGCYRDVDGRWSVAWRTLDAQYWGVPQRRRRIALVADFGGNTAPEILFERESVSGDPAPRGETRKGTAAEAERSACASSYALRIRGGCEGGGKGPLAQIEKSGTLGTGNDQTIFVFWDGKSTKQCGNNTPFVCIPINDKATRYQGGGDTRKNDGAGNGLGIGKDGDPSPTLTNGDRHGIAVLPFDTTQITSPQNGCKPKYGDPCHPLCAGAHPPAVACKKEIQIYAEQRHGEYKKSNNFSTQTNRQYKSATDLVYDGFVRRLTPLECERLQGFPDGWTDIGVWYDEKGKKHKPADSPRYKTLGNSIALPPWRFVLGRIYANLPQGASLGSLFDGIGGFPLIWRELGGVPLWASEIEEFPIAVTKKRFGNI